MDAATGNERQPTVAIDDMPERAAGVKRMSADDDDQADQQHELAYPVCMRGRLTAREFWGNFFRTAQPMIKGSFLGLLRSTGGKRNPVPYGMAKRAFPHHTGCRFRHIV